MIVENINKTPLPLKVLVAPLDWGLGHATRCIPIIHALTELKITVVLAASGPIATIFQKEFPSLKILPLGGYNITYGRTKSSFKYSLMLKLPRIISCIRYENKWLKQLLASEHFDAVISDNRFGMYHRQVPSVYITHQLNIQTGSKLSDWIARRIHYSFVNRYSECWVPDAAFAPNLGAILSHPVVYPKIPTRYLGLISRFQKKPVQKDIDLLIILSGPEPQRSMLEKLILDQLSELPRRAVLVRGLPAGPPLNHTQFPMLEIYDHLPASELSTLIQRSDMVVSRCGYSTVMDLAILRQKAILVPTPGQTEQEYLAGYLYREGYFFTCTQEKFALADVLTEASKFKGKTFPEWKEEYKKVILNFIQQLPASS
jgi:UDP:flavonoid glycosyltransferase YjiC (YdhE family)